MPKPPVSLSLAAAISLECLHVLDSNYLPCDTHRAAVKSHTLLHIGNILVFKNGASTVCKKTQKQTHRNLFLAIANRNSSLATRRVQNLWTPKAFLCKVGLVKKRVFRCFVQNRESDWSVISAQCVTGITSFLSVREWDEPAAYGKNHEHRSARPKRPSGGECSRGQR